MVAWDVAVAEVLAHDRGVLALDQCVVVAASGAAFGELDMELLQQPGDLVVDVLGAVVRVEAADEEGKGLECMFKHRDEEKLADAFDGVDRFVLRDGIDQVDDVNAFYAIEVALMDGVHPQVTRLAVGLRSPPFTDRDGGRSGGFEASTLASIADAGTQVVQVRNRNSGEVLIVGITKNTEGALRDLLRSRSRELAMEPVQFDQTRHIGVRKAPSKRLRRRPATVVQPARGEPLRYPTRHLRF